MKFVIEIPRIPPTVNRIFCTFNRRARILTNDFREFKRLVERIVNGAQIPDDWDYVKVSLYLTPTRRQKMDGDNFFKATFDALTGAGFWRDDSQVATASFFFTEPSKEPKTTVVVERAFEKFDSKLAIDRTNAKELKCDFYYY